MVTLGDEIWFTATDTGANLSLYAVTLSGEVRVLIRVPGGIKLQDVARNGRVLLARGDPGSAPSACSRETPRKRPVLAGLLLRRGHLAGRPDAPLRRGGGSGRHQLHRVHPEGGCSPVVKLGEGAALSLSTDGRWALAALSSPKPFFMLLPTGAGEPSRLQIQGSAPARPRRGFPTARSCSRATSRTEAYGSFVQDVGGGKPRPITPEGIGTAFPGFAISPDGKAWLRSGPTGGDDLSARGRDRLERSPASSTASFHCGSARRPLPLRLEARATGARLPRRSGDGKARALEGADAGRPGRRRADFQCRHHARRKSYAYTYSRLLSDLFVVEGLK